LISRTRELLPCRAVETRRFISIFALHPPTRRAMRAPPLRIAILLLLALPLQGCTRWSSRPIPAPGQHEYIVGTVRVTRADGSVLVLDNVSVRADSVTGTVHRLAGQRFAIPTGQVRSLAIQRENSVGTVAVMLAAAAAVLGLWGYAVLATEGPGS
jgi:hypothetical protein